jgi:phosphotransacetylase
MLPGFDELMRSADEAQAAFPVVAAGGDDPTVLEALSAAQKRGWVTPILVGNETRIRELAEQLKIDLAVFQIMHSETPGIDAVQIIHAQKKALLMKGQIATPELLKAVLNSETGLRTGRVICQMVLMEIMRDQRRFLMTDTGITIQPTLSQKADLVMHAIETAELLGVANARIALMAATEKVNASLPDTLDAQKICEQAATGAFGPCQVAGPLSFDLAYASDAGSKKKIEGDVVGAADAMVFPDLTSANLTVKGMMYTADCRFGGILCGTKVPVVFMSRADNTQTRIHSLAFALSVYQADLATSS